MCTRREFVAGALGLPALASRPKGPLVDTHIHIFSPDQKRFPYHRNATYRPPARPLESYLEFVRAAKLDHTIIIHPEPYQDDHSLLEHCLTHEPWPGFFKGTCLFDPIAPETPARMEALMKKHPGRIVALRIHATQGPSKPPTTSGPIRDRDLTAPAMRETWAAALRLGLAIQMHFIPHYAPRIRALGEQFRDLAVILDHLGRAGEGTPAEYEHVLKLAELPRVVMKFSGVTYSSKQGYPFRDVKPLVRRLFDAFGPERMICGGLGMNMTDFEKNVAMLEAMFDFTTEENRRKIRGGNALRLYGFRG